MKKLTRYPWERWLRRKTKLVLVYGTDYQCQPHSMAQQCRNAATRSGVRLSIHIDGDTITVVNRGRAA